MPNPIQFQTVFGTNVVEPAVTGYIDVEQIEPFRPTNVNNLIIVSPFRSGQPNTLKGSFRTLTSFGAYFDPDATGDQGVALAGVAKTAFADVSVFGAADLYGIRPGSATASSLTLVDTTSPAVPLLTISRTDYGAQTNRARATVVVGTVVGMKLTLSDDVVQRTVVGDNLGPLLTILYKGTGSACKLYIRTDTGTITYTAAPTAENDVIVNGTMFTFGPTDSAWIADDVYAPLTSVKDANGNVQTTTAGGTSGATAPVWNTVVGGTTTDGTVTWTLQEIGVAIGTAAVTFANLVTAINANVPGVTATQTIGTGTTGTVALSGPEEGVSLTATSTVITVSNSGLAASLRTIATGATSDNLAIALAFPAYESLQALVNFINSQGNYTASIVTGANQFLASTSLDIVSSLGVDIKTAAATLTGYSAAIVDWVNHNTRGLYSAVWLTSTVNTPATLTTTFFTGALTPPVTATDWTNALTTIGSQMQLGGILLIDTDEPSILSSVEEFCQEQRTLGKWFRFYAGLQPGLAVQQGSTWDVAAYLQISGLIDDSLGRLTCQQLGNFAADGTIEYLHPVYYAAALAGGAAGNEPYVQTLTAKILRFAALKDSDNFDQSTRESLLMGGINVVKREEGNLVNVMHVTSSQDPTRRMPRIAAEIDTVDEFDSNLRAALLPLRGAWANTDVAGKIMGILLQVFNSYVQNGAFSPGVDPQGNPVPPYQLQNPPFVIYGGVLTIQGFTINIGGEIDQVSEQGDAEYARIVGSLSSSKVVQMPAINIAR